VAGLHEKLSHRAMAQGDVGGVLHFNPVNQRFLARWVNHWFHPTFLNRHFLGISVSSLLSRCLLKLPMFVTHYLDFFKRGTFSHPSFHHSVEKLHKVCLDHCFVTLCSSLEKPWSERR
jgi:hypothetical protein